MMKLFILALFVSYVAANGVRVRLPKSFRPLTAICQALNASSLIVNDTAFEDLFENLGDFCDNFFMELGITPIGVYRDIDGIPLIIKTCRWFTRRYDVAPMDGPLVGLGAICNATERALSRSVMDRDSRRIVARINLLCSASRANLVAVRASGFAGIFVRLDGFCDNYLNMTGITAPVPVGPINGIVILEDICDWYLDKFVEERADGVLGDIEEICEDFDELLEGL